MLTLTCSMARVTLLLICTVCFHVAHHDVALLGSIVDDVVAVVIVTVAAKLRRFVQLWISSL